jgi:hypothetical protein
VISAQQHPMISATTGTRAKDLRSPVDGFSMLAILQCGRRRSASPPEKKNEKGDP